MTTINGTEQLLNQIRSMRANLDIPTSPTEGVTPNRVGDTNFGNLLKTTIDSVNTAQKSAAEMRMEFEQGINNRSLAEVMIAGEKAKLSFEAATEVRNKLVTTYQDIMNMPV